MGDRVARSRLKGPHALAQHARGGYTLLELIAVIALISLTLAFALPRFDGQFGGQSNRKGLRWIMIQTKLLRQKARLERQQQILHVNIDANRLWATSAAMPEEERETAAEQGYQLPEDLDIVDLEFPDGVTVGSGVVPVRFYPEGYSDHLVFHLETTDGDRLSLRLEPFLSDIKLYDSDWRFDT